MYEYVKGKLSKIALKALLMHGEPLRNGHMKALLFTHTTNAYPILTTKNAQNDQIFCGWVCCNQYT